MPTGAADVKLKLGEGITGWVARTGKTVRLGNVIKDPRYVMLRRNVRSELAVPLAERGEMRGVVNVDSDRADAFSQQDEDLLQTLAGDVIQVIHNTWLYEQMRLKTRLLETLLSVGQTINSTLNLNDVFPGHHPRGLRADGGQSLLHRHVRRKRASGSNCAPQHGAGPAYINKPRMSVEDSFAGMVVRRKKPMQLDNVQMSGFYQNTTVAREEGLVSLLSTPLIYSGQAIGALNIFYGKRHAFSNEEIHILSALAQLSAIAIEKARLYERIVDGEEKLRQNEKLSALGLLAAEVAHEIRNPLTVMKMLYHSLDLRFEPGDPRIKDDAIFREKMDHLNKIVEQILDFARSAEPKLTPVNVNQLIDDLALLIRHKLRNQGIQFVKKLDPSLPPVMADATQLSQAFLNLALNAAQAMPTGGSLSISTCALSQPKESLQPTHIRIEFKDTGSGIPKENQKRAFSHALGDDQGRRHGPGIGHCGTRGSRPIAAK